MFYTRVYIIYFIVGAAWLYGPWSHGLRATRRPKLRRRQMAVYPSYGWVGSKSFRFMKP